LHVLYECRAPTQPYPLSLHDALPISGGPSPVARGNARRDEGLLRAVRAGARQGAAGLEGLLQQERQLPHVRPRGGVVRAHRLARDRKSTRLNSSHEWISYAVFCLKKK